MSKGLIFDIKKYAINDGPGIRITLFFKGCPLSCIWCHNPEGISEYQQKMYAASKCIGAIKCIEVCPEGALTLTPEGIVTDTERCTLCGKCALACPTKAIEMSGREYTTDELMKIIERETIFFDHSEGGVTFSGGEPLMHHQKLLELLDRCGQKQIHTVVDTALFAKTEIVLEVANQTNLFLVDLKAFDSEIHKRYTGISNELILKNITVLADNGHDFIIRIPFIHGVNTDKETLEKEATFLSKLSWKRKEINLLLYHDIAKGKHQKLGTNFNREGLETPSNAEIELAKIIFGAAGLKVSVGG